MQKDIDEIKKIVNEYMQQEKIAVFVGAGVSTLSEYPSWEKLVLSMASEIGYNVTLKDDDGNDRLSSDEYLKIPQIYYDKKREKDYLKTVRKQLNVYKEPNKIHKLIMRLNPNHILTTNYDTLIEQAANFAGLSYSVINSDKKVAYAPTRKYIIKVHGDFEEDNFVLKEDDYLNYETNFKLIDNLIKTIISTHLVIFIGYSLGDYNIKLILNWVKQVQKDSFIEPIFIHTGKRELSDLELSYYNGGNLKVVDANKLVDNPQKADYMERYYEALITLLDSNLSENWHRNETWIVDHFYKIIEPLKDVKYIRYNDMAGLLPGSIILHNNCLKYQDSKYLLQAYKKMNKLSQKRLNQLNDVIFRFHNSGIERILDVDGDLGTDFNNRIKRGNYIDNDTFLLSYQEIAERISQYGDDIDSQYSKAYDLYWIGRFDEAMDIYSQLLADCYSQKRWILYYFTQINLFYLRQTIISLYRELKSVRGALRYYKTYAVWSDEQMSNIQLSHLISDVPSEIRRYKFLSKLTEKNYYKDDFVDMYKDNYEMEKMISKNQYTLGGQTKDFVSKIKLYDSVNFIYGNKITFDKFDEHKKFIKISMIQRLKSMLYQNELISKNSSVEKNSYIDFHDCLLMIRTFDYDDLVTFYDNINCDRLLLDEESLIKFEKYIKDLMHYFIDNQLTDSNKERFIEYVTLNPEIRNGLYMAANYVQNDILLNECIGFLFGPFLDQGMDIYKNNKILLKMYNRMNDKTIIKDYLEKDIMNKINICNSTNLPIILLKNQIAFEVERISDWFPGYKSEILKEKIEELKEDDVLELHKLLERII